MVKKKSSKAKLTSVSLNLPWVTLSWESDESELRALRDLVNEIRGRSAFELDRGMLDQHPAGFFLSVVELRTKIREKFLPQLPVDANESRLLFLAVINCLGEIIDKWHTAMSEVNPSFFDLNHFDMDELTKIKELSWKTVEDVRKRLDELCQDLEGQLKLSK